MRVLEWRQLTSDDVDSVECEGHEDEEEPHEAKCQEAADGEKRPHHQRHEYSCGGRMESGRGTD